MTKRKKPRYPNKLLVAGVAVVVVGGVLLLWNLGYLPQPGRLWPVPVIIVGLLFLYMAWPQRRSDRWIIPGMVLTLGGVVFLLVNTVLSEQSLARIWPAFMVVTGVSLVPYGFRKKGSARTAIVASSSSASPSSSSLSACATMADSRRSCSTGGR
jgi:peptidoglycan/LPS O-acetylase OafA/YrhL